jgi:hypothetical protein
VTPEPNIDAATKARIDAAKATARIFLTRIIAEPERGRAMVFRDAVADAASAHFDLDRAVEVVRKAEAGDKEAGDAVCRAAAWYLENGEMVPDVLRPYAILVWKTGRAPRAKRTSKNNALRDQCIVAAVRGVRECGFDLTRNKGSRGRPSACSIVAEVLAEIGIHMSEGNVGEICRLSQN